MLKSGLHYVEQSVLRLVRCRSTEILCHIMHRDPHGHDSPRSEFVEKEAAATVA